MLNCEAYRHYRRTCKDGARPDADLVFHRSWGDNTLAAGVMRFKPRSPTVLDMWEYFNRKQNRPRNWSPLDDQGVYREFYAEAASDPVYFPDWWIGSYKWITNQMGKEARGTIEEAVVMCMHGKPDPPDIIKDKMPLWEIIEREWK